MAGLIAKQPNGLYCRISTVVDAPTHWNMTEQEAIKILNPDADVVWKAHDGKDMERCNEACRVACVALAKQIPKKPKNYLVNMKHIDFLCPNCKKKIISKVDGEWVAGKKQQHCDNCGQALDWSDVEE